MDGWLLLESVIGILLVFFLPGYALSKAVFPEWRVRGPDALRHAVELLTLSFLLSVVLTVLIGYLFLTGVPGGFRAGWSDPLLESVLGAITVIGVALAAARGAFARVPPGPPFPPRPSTEEGAFELTRELDRLRHEERRVLHLLRTEPPDSEEHERLSARLEKLRTERDELARHREAEYAD